jgi:hypothetical protein
MDTALQMGDAPLDDRGGEMEAAASGNPFLRTVEIPRCVAARAFAVRRTLSMLGAAQTGARP